MRRRYALHTAASFLAVGAVGVSGPLHASESTVPPGLRHGMQLDASRPGATPAERPSRPFAGWLAVRGCEFQIDGSFTGRIQDGRISGMAGEGSDFSWPIAPDGSFAGQIALGTVTEDGRLHQWVEGRIEGSRLILDVRFGVTGRPERDCRADNQTLDLGG